MTPDPHVITEFGRERVLALRTSTRRRVFAAALSVHRLSAGYGGSTRAGDGAVSDAAFGPAFASWKAPLAGTSGWDWHLRRELAGRLLEQSAHQAEDAGADAAAPVLLAWTRPGAAEHEDSDAAWWAAAHSACADLQVRLLGLAVVTRWGWWMLPEGPGRRWQRLRHHDGKRLSTELVATAQLADGQPSGQV